MTHDRKVRVVLPERGLLRQIRELQGKLECLKRQHQVPIGRFIARKVRGFPKDRSL